MSKKIKAFRDLIVGYWYEGWEDDVLELAAEPGVASELPELLAGLKGKHRSRLIELGDQEILLAFLRTTSSAAGLRRIVSLLFRVPDVFHQPEVTHRVLDAIAAQPAAAKLAMQTWQYRDEYLPYLAYLARAVESDKKCKKLAVQALAYVDETAEQASFPTFANHLGLSRIGATMTTTTSHGTGDAPWPQRVIWPSKSFVFSVPKDGKSTLSFERDERQDTRRQFSENILDLLYIGYDDIGWSYYCTSDGAFVRTLDDMLQFLVFFFSWIGKEVAKPDAPANPLVGKWIATTVLYESSADGDPDYDPETRDAAPNEATLVLEPDGSFEFANFSYERLGTYVTQGHELVLSFSDQKGEKAQMEAKPPFFELVWVDYDEEHDSNVKITLKRA